jgi:thymidylate synthase
MPLSLFPFFGGDLVYGDGDHIGLCTLWSPKDRYEAQRPHVAAIGSLYSRAGIGGIIRNYLAVPRLQHLVITGVDCPEPTRRQGDALKTGAFAPSELGLTETQVAAFYEGVRIWDARNIRPRQQETLAQLLATLPRYEVQREAVMVPLPEATRATFPTARSGHLIRADSIGEGYHRLLSEIRTFGEMQEPDKEGHVRQELWQLTVCLTAAVDWRRAPLYAPEELERYGKELWEGSEPEGVAYRYGHLMRRQYGDQIAAVLFALRANPGTYKAVISLWGGDSLFMNDAPCLTQVHVRIRNGVLDMAAVIRSNEMSRGWPKNAAGLRYLQERFAQEVGATLGELAITSGSAHLYDYDWLAVDAYLSKPRPHVITFDPKGDWRLYRDGGEVVAEHYHQGLPLQTLRAESVEAMARLIEPFISVPSHGVHIGMELQKLRQEANYG